MLHGIRLTGETQEVVELTSEANAEQSTETENEIEISWGGLGSVDDDLRRAKNVHDHADIVPIQTEEE